MIRNRWIYTGLLGVFLAAGCGDGSSLAEVSGVVNFEGKPVERGAITFFPVSGKGATTGAMIVDGKFTAHVPYGDLKVSISSPKVVGRRKLYPTPQSPEAEITAEALPRRYNEATELKMTVQDAVVNKDFDLKK